MEVSINIVSCNRKQN